MSTALVREVSPGFTRALVRGGRALLDVELARAQHTAYVGHLAEAGYEIEQLPGDETYPDCVFVEDTAVVLGSTAVITRPGAPTRRGETTLVADRLARRFPIVEIEEPGTLDGGDVFVSGGTVYVGRSSRTNDAGVEQLGAVAEMEGFGLVALEVHGALHLKSAVLPIAEGTVVVTPDAVEEIRLAGLELIYEDPTERHRFSALPLADGTVLVTASAPRTARLVAERGLEVIPIDVSQIQAADGGLTCMSVLF